MLQEIETDPIYRFYLKFKYQLRHYEGVTIR